MHIIVITQTVGTLKTIGLIFLNVEYGRVLRCPEVCSIFCLFLQLGPIDDSCVYS